MNVPVAQGCEHQWTKYDYKGKPDEVHCAECEATPAEVIAVVGYVTMNCEPAHEVDNPNHPFGTHIDPTWHGDDAQEHGFWECETVMPGWSDDE